MLNFFISWQKKYMNMTLSVMYSITFNLFGGQEEMQTKTTPTTSLVGSR
jgi:hypothetical protein